MRCIAYCTGENYSLKALSQFFTDENAKLKLYNKEVLHISQYKDGDDLFFFDYGCIVFWNYKPLKEEQVLETLAQFAMTPLKKQVSELQFV